MDSASKSDQPWKTVSYAKKASPKKTLANPNRQKSGYVTDTVSKGKNTKKTVQIKTKIPVNRTPDIAIFSIPPLFLYANALPDKVTDLQICQASIRLTGANNVVAAQRFGPIWHLYPKTMEDRALLAGRIMSIDGREATLFSKNPAHLINQYNQPLPSAKLTIGGIPLLIPSEMVTDSLVQEGFKPRSPVYFDQIQIKEGIPSHWYSGTRVVYIDVPNKTPPPIITIASYDCQVHYIDYLGRGYVKEQPDPQTCQPKAAAQLITDHNQPKALDCQSDVAQQIPQPGLGTEGHSIHVDTSGNGMTDEREEGECEEDDIHLASSPNKIPLSECIVNMAGPLKSLHYLVIYSYILDLEEGELIETMTSRTSIQSDKNIIELNFFIDTSSALNTNDIKDTSIPSVSNNVAPSKELEEDRELPDTTPSVSNNVAPTIVLEDGELPNTPPPQTAPLLEEIVIDVELLDASSTLNAEDLEEIFIPSVSNEVALMTNPPNSSNPSVNSFTPSGNSAGEAVLASSTSGLETNDPAFDPSYHPPAPVGCTNGDSAHIDVTSDTGEQTTGVSITTGVSAHSALPSPPGGTNIGKSANSEAPSGNIESNSPVPSAPSIHTPALWVPSSGDIAHSDSTPDSTPDSSEQTSSVSITTNLNAPGAQASGLDMGELANIEASSANSELIPTSANAPGAQTSPPSRPDVEETTNIESFSANIESKSPVATTPSNHAPALGMSLSSGETALSDASSDTSNLASNHTPTLSVRSSSGESALSDVSSATSNLAPDMPDEADVSKAEDLLPASVLEALFATPLEERDSPCSSRGNIKVNSPNKKAQLSSIPRANSFNSSLLTRSRGLLPDREHSRSRSTSRKRSKDSMTDVTPEGPAQRSRLGDGN